MAKEPSGDGVLNSGESDFCLVRETKLIRIPRPQELLAIQHLLLVLHSLWLVDLCMSDGMLQYLVLFDWTFLANLKLLDDFAHFSNPVRIIMVERLDVYQALANWTVRKRLLQKLKS